MAGVFRNSRPERRAQQPDRRRAPARRPPTAQAAPANPARPAQAPAAAPAKKPAAQAPAQARPAARAPAAAAPQASPRAAAPQAAAPQAAAAQAPAAHAQAPKKQEGGGFGGFLQGLKDKAASVVQQVQPQLTDDQRKAAEHVRGMLEPNKLGGADRVFNYGDVDAVVKGLMCDTCGLRAETQQQLRNEGKSFQANLVGRALGGGRGPLKNMARNKVYQEAPGRIRQQLQAGLQEARVDPATARRPDRTPRNVTFDEMRSFQQNAAVLQQMQEETSRRLGVDITFPNGLSQKSIDFMLNGGIGFPPGAKVRYGGDR